MADPPDRQPGQRSLFELGVQRVEKRRPPEVDRAEVEREMEAKRQARMQRVADAAAAALAAKRPVGRPMGSGKKPGAWAGLEMGRHHNEHGREPVNHLPRASKSFGKSQKLGMPPVNLSSKMWKLQGLPVNHLERKIFWSTPTPHS
jgi:hypothetical protein